jgi:hypothetical protein
MRLEEAANGVFIGDVAIGVTGEDGVEAALGEDFLQVLGEHSPATGDDD